MTTTSEQPPAAHGLGSAGSRRGRPLDLSVGEWVQVKSEAEILATLDAAGQLEALPFMPEMLQYCGGRFRVSRRADKTCDGMGAAGLRHMRDAVHLGELRCDGAMHDGCQAGCLLFWKEAWLKRCLEPPSGEAAGDVPGHIEPRLQPVCSRAALMAATRSLTASGETTYSCQATELQAATSPLPWWHVTQYVRDLRSGNATPARLVRAVAIGVFNRTQRLLSRVAPSRFLYRGGAPYPFIQGTLARTPTRALGLQPGDVVEIKTKEEIVATLDSKNRNRGLLFDREEVRYCGRRARVLRRVNRIIDERTRKMVDISGDSVILEDVYCHGDFNRFCTRSIYSFWREIWLKRIGDSRARDCEPTAQRS